MTLPALVVRTLALFVVGALLMALGTVGKPAAVRRARVIKLLVYFVIVHAVLGLSSLGRAGVLGLVGAILVVSAWEGTRAWRRTARPRFTVMAWAAVAVAAACAAAAWRMVPASVAWLFMCTAAFDGFSQVVGQWLGRHALVPSISPAKTVEGMLGGLLGAALVAVWLRDLVALSAGGAAALGALVAAASLAGDLAGSWTKRRAGIKDFSSLLPGQGGVLDRFNSFIAAMGLVGVWL